MDYKDLIKNWHSKASDEDWSEKDVNEFLYDVVNDFGVMAVTEKKEK